MPAPAPSRVAPARSSTATATCAAPRVALPRRPGRGGRQPESLDRVPCVEPPGLDRPRLRAGGSGRHQDHSPARHLLDEVARGPARRRADVDSSRPSGRRRQGDPEEPDGARGPPQLPLVRRSGRSFTGRAAGPHRGLLPQVPDALLLRSEAEGRRPGRRPVRGRRRDRARRAGLDLRRPRPQRVRSLGRAQGPAQLWGPRRARRRHRRAPVPGAGGAPAASSRSTTS